MSFRLTTILKSSQVRRSDNSEVATNPLTSTYTSAEGAACASGRKGLSWPMCCILKAWHNRGVFAGRIYSNKSQEHFDTPNQLPHHKGGISQSTTLVCGPTVTVIFERGVAKHVLGRAMGRTAPVSTAAVPPTTVFSATGPVPAMAASWWPDRPICSSHAQRFMAAAALSSTSKASPPSQHHHKHVHGSRMLMSHSSSPCTCASRDANASPVYLLSC